MKQTRSRGGEGGGGGAAAAAARERGRGERVEAAVADFAELAHKPTTESMSPSPSVY